LPVRINQLTEIGVYYNKKHIYRSGWELCKINLPWPRLCNTFPMLYHSCKSMQCFQRYSCCVNWGVLWDHCKLRKFVKNLIICSQLSCKHLHEHRTFELSTWKLLIWETSQPSVIIWKWKIQFFTICDSIEGKGWSCGANFGVVKKLLPAFLISVHWSF